VPSPHVRETAWLLTSLRIVGPPELRLADESSITGTTVVEPSLAVMIVASVVRSVTFVSESFAPTGEPLPPAPVR